VQIDRLVVDEVGERAHRVRAAARAGDHVGREVAGLLDRLLARLLGDDRLEVADHHRERVRADDRADDVVGVLDGGRPVAHRLGDGLLQGASARRDRVHLGAVELHPEDVGALAVDVALAHVDLTGHVEVGGRHRGRGAVLAGARLRDDALFAHVLRQEDLPEGVVQLVRAAVEEVLAFEEHLAVVALREPVGALERRRSAAEVREPIAELVHESVSLPRT